MGMKIIIPGADFSASANPSVIDLVAGLPAADLAALYLFEDGTIGSAYTGVIEDVTGNGNDATFIASSSARRSAFGFETAADNTTRNRGFGIDTGINVSEKFTVFGVSRNRLAADSSITGQYVMPWSLSRNFSNAVAPDLSPGAQGAINGEGIGGILHINQQNTGGTTNYAEIASYSSKQSPDTNQAWAGSTRPSVGNTAQPKSSWIAWALAFDKDVGYEFRTLGTGTTVNAPTQAGQFYTGHGLNTSKHLFGAMAFSGSNINGEIAMAGIYDGVAKTASEMDALIAAMKTSLAGREMTIL